jgi:hypothetical protein
VAEWLPSATLAESLSGRIASAANPVECKQHYPDLIFLRSESMCVMSLKIFVLFECISSEVLC